MVKVKVIRGVYIKGTAYGEGAIVEVSDADYGELKSARYVEKYEEKPAPAKKDEPATAGTGKAAK